VSGYILCQTKRAKLPYFIENISTNVYSIEELCYYLYHNLYLIDQTIMNEGLCSWIQEELELPALAAKLRSKISKFASAEDIVYPVFKEINYLTYEELKELNVRLQKMNEETPAMREKQKADALMENEMYVHAIQVYQNLLEREDLEEIREGMTEKVYHNLGCAYSYLFQMEKALECFWEAFLTEGDENELICYLLAYKKAKKPQEYEKKLASLNVSEEVKQKVKEALEYFEKEKEEPVKQENIDEMLEKLTGEYHRSTGV
jgi:tetratricopeptide (TPR) repeat protein